jgi:type II secretory pathway component PulM
VSWRDAWARLQQWYAGHSERDRRIILGVAAAVALALVYVAVVEPIRDYRRAVAEEIEDGLERRDHWAAQVRTLNAKTAERDDLRRRLDDATRRLLPGTSGTLGAAALQERANTLASEKGITVQSTQVMRDEAVDPFRKVTVRLMLSGEIKPFAELVAGLEYGPQQLMLPFVEVSRRGAVAGAKGPRTLTATIEVTGFQRTAAAETAEPAEGEAPVEGEAQAPAKGEAPVEAAPPEGVTTTTLVPPEGAPATVPGPEAPEVAAPVPAPDAAATTTTSAPAPPAPAPGAPPLPAPGAS